VWIREGWSLERNLKIIVDERRLEPGKQVWIRGGRSLEKK
jgi:hypothetical protein